MLLLRLGALPLELTITTLLDLEKTFIGDDASYVYLWVADSLASQTQPQM